MEFRLSKVLVPENGVIRRGTWEKCNAGPGLSGLEQVAFGTAISSLKSKFMLASL